MKKRVSINLSVKNKLIPILLVIFLYTNTSYVFAHSSNIQFKNITIDDGLSQSTVEALYQDSNGYIWIGTNDGLDRYNGYEFKKYKQGNDPSTNIASNYILSIKEDNKKNIWVATVSGLSKIDTKSNKVTNYFDTKETGNLSNYNVCDILITKDSEILVATGDGLNIYDEKNDSFKRILKDNLTSQDIYSLDQDENGNIWIGTYGGLNKIDVKTKSVKTFYSKDKESISEDTIYKVYSDKNGYVWVGTFSSGLNKININTNKVTVYKNIDEDSTSLPGNFVRSILKDSEDNIWVATDRGIAKYNEDSEAFLNYSNDLGNRYSLLNDDVFSLMQDNTGLIWIGTYEGISLFDPRNNITHYKKRPSEKQSLNSNVIHGIYEDDSENLWVGTRSNGINIINRKKHTVQYITRDNGLSSNSINYITGDKNYIWVATNDGLNRINKKTNEIKIYGTKEGIKNNKIKSLCLDSKGYLWIGTENSLGILNTTNDEMKDMDYIFDKYKINDKYISAIHEDSQGNYWIGTFKDGGLIKVDTKHNAIKNYKKDLRNNNSITSNSIRCIIDDTKGNIWVGTNYGLNKFDLKTQKFKSYTEKDGLSSNTVYGTLLDDKKDIWMSTNYGISKLDAETDIFTNYNVADGFQSNEFNAGAYFKNNKGELFFGGINGFNIFEPSQIYQDRTSIPSVKFDEFIVNDVSYKDINNMKFDYTGNSIRIKYFLPDYKDTKNNRYYYKIEGHDSDWNVTDNNEIIYKDLDPGKYTFVIKAINHHGIESKESKVTFIIKPHILLSSMAFCIYILIISIILYLNATKVKRLDRLVDKKTLQLQKEMIKNKKLFDKLIKLEQNKTNYFVNLSHELRTPLNVISTTQQLILELNKRDEGIDKEKIDYHTIVMQTNTNRLLNLINNIIDTSKIEDGSYNIDIKENDIVYLVEETCLSLKDYIESNGLNLIIDPEIEEKIIECDKDEIERCIVNLISNAKKFTPRGGKIEVTIKDLDDFVQINVCDTGIGIPKDKQDQIFNRFNQVVDENYHQKGGSGLGLTITKHIINLHNGDIYVSSEENKGSTFTILLPVKLNKNI